MKILEQFFSAVNNSYLFDQARTGRRTVHWLLLVPVLPVLMLGGIAAGVLLLRFTGVVPAETAIEDSDAPGALLLLALFIPIWVTVGLWVRLYERRSLLSVGFARPGGVRMFAIGLLQGMALMVLVVVINWLAGGYVLDPDRQAWPTLSVLATVFMLLIAFAVQGGAEELALRGWLMPVIGARYNRVVAILLPVFLFVLLHGAPEGRPMYGGVSLTMFTLAMTLWALRDGSIARAIGVHAGWNWSAGQLFGLNISNSSWGTDSIFYFTQVGGTKLSGGSGGPEWSLATLVVWTACVAVLASSILRHGVYRPADQRVVTGNGGDHAGSDAS